MWVYYIQICTWYQTTLNEEHLPGYVWAGAGNECMWHVPTTRLCPW